MEAILPIVQQFLSAGGMPNLEANQTTNGTSPTTSTTMPTDVTSLFALLFSFSALRDWFKFFVFGGVLETSRRLLTSTWYWLIASFWITAHWEEDDTSYNWIMLWLSLQPAWKRAREVQISTRSFGLNSTEVDEDELNGSRHITYLPSVSTSYTVWYKGTLLKVQRVTSTGGYYGRKEETLTISILSRTHAVLDDLLRDAKKAYMDAQEHTISVYIADSANNWRHVASRPKRPMSSIVLPPGIKELLVDDAQDFLESKSWYADRGIPFRRGYLLYGSPGTGKTSMIHSLAGELGLDVYVLSLSRAGLDDTSLAELISELPEKCIALMEDVDAAFQSGITNRDLDEGIKSNPDAPPNPNAPPAAPAASRITLSGLLNALDGVGAQEGRILYATTNRYEALDAALCRPGRMDLHVEFKHASQWQASELFKCFYLPPNEESEEKKKERLDKEALKKKRDSSADSGVSLREDDKASEKKTDASGVRVSYTGASHRVRAPRLSRLEVDNFAAQFSVTIPPDEFSMASLQGYLMTYKTRPLEAIKEAPAWVEEERRKKREKKEKAAAKNKVKVEPAPAVVVETNESSAEV